MTRSIFDRIGRNHVAAAHDALMAAVSLALSMYVRLGEDDWELASGYLLPATAVFTLIAVSVFSSMRLYRGLWRYASMRDMLAIVKAVSLSILIFALCMFLFNRLEHFPRSIFLIQWLCLVCLLSGPRFAYRAMKDRTLSWQMKLEEVTKIPVLLIGANPYAEQFIRDMSRDPNASYEIVGIVDNDSGQHGSTMHQVPIYGSMQIIDTIIRKLERKDKRPQKLILTDDNYSGEVVRQLLDKADGLAIPLARLPRLSQFKTNMNDRPEIQPIAIEDLLGRPQQVLDRESMRALVSGKAVMVTGAGGTIGGELVRQICAFEPAKLVLLEASEFNLYQIEREIRGKFPALALDVVLCDVRNQPHVNHLFAAHRPQVVVHAAAIKHVPMSEFNIEEAIRTNAFGTRNIADACLTHKVGVMVMISTDKAVNPTNVMGASKRLAESVCQSYGAMPGNTHFITVRFGNVLGSTGSVVPLFQEQLAKGGPITVTHPDMTRYFMTVREAVELVLQAAALGVSMPRRECVFVLDMGKPVKIVDLAQQMIRLAGLKPGQDIQIKFTGLRPGEKLYEELFYASEGAAKTSHSGIFLANPKQVESETLRNLLDKLAAACDERRPADALALLKQLVPEFTHESHTTHETRTALRIG